MAGTAAWIDVLPNLSAFGTKLNSGVTAAATSAGRNAGKKFSDAMNQAAGRDVLSEQVKSLQQAEKKAAQAVSQCTSQIAKARDEQKSADLRVQAAEVKLQETIVKSGQSSSQAINAQARLNDARSKARQKTEASPDCPQCGRPMRRRKSAKGDFWGCAGYPDCKGTRPV